MKYLTIINHYEPLSPPCTIHHTSTAFARRQELGHCQFVGHPAAGTGGPVAAGALSAGRRMMKQCHRQQFKRRGAMIGRVCKRKKNRLPDVGILGYSWLFLLFKEQYA